MKTKDKQNSKKKALDFIKKYQLGGDNFSNNPYEYDPNLDIAQSNQLVAPPLNQLNETKSQIAFQPVKPKPNVLDSAIPFISPAINLGIGVANIFSSIKEQSRQKAYERAFRKDLEKRKNDARFNDFYATPYSVSSGSVRSGAPGYQMGGTTDNQMQMFIDYYNSNEQANQNLDQQFNDYYNQKNNQMEMGWKNKRSSGLNSLISGVTQLVPLLQEGGQIKEDTIDSLRRELQDRMRDIDIRKAAALQKVASRDTLKNYNKIVNGADSEDLKIGFKSNKFSDRFREHQEGGTTGDLLNPVIDPTQDIYSPEYKVPPEVEDELSQAQIEEKTDDAFTNWLFEDNPEEQDDQTNVDYFKSLGEEDNESDNGIEENDVIDQIGQQESGGNYEAKNPYSSASGKYQFTDVWAGQIKSFMGLPDSFTRDQVMQVFRKSPQAQEQFMQYVVNNVYKPEVERLRPLAQKYGLDDNKLIRMLHYRGVGDTRKRLKEGDFSVNQEEKDKYKNPDILSYLNK